jgi:peptidoglycan/LPS O-acetylase OafA/YrhL
MNILDYFSLKNQASPLFAIGLIAIAFLCSDKLLSTKTVIEKQRYASFDGLRGICVIFVFIQHIYIWFYYNKTGQWILPKSNLYSQFGSGAVAIFFMITSFLFWGKIRDSEKIDWIKLYTSRFLRITPIYYLSIIIMMIMAFFIAKRNSNHTLIIDNFLHYVFFSFGGVWWRFAKPVWNEEHVSIKRRSHMDTSI